MGRHSVVHPPWGRKGGGCSPKGVSHGLTCDCLCRAPLPPPHPAALCPPHARLLPCSPSRRPDSPHSRPGLRPPIVGRMDGRPMVGSGPGRPMLGRTGSTPVQALGVMKAPRGRTRVRRSLALHNSGTSDTDASQVGVAGRGEGGGGRRGGWGMFCGACLRSPGLRPTYPFPPSLGHNPPFQSQVGVAGRGEGGGGRRGGGKCFAGPASPPLGCGPPIPSSLPRPQPTLPSPFVTTTS
jgi:hypothetical protein